MRRLIRVDGSTLDLPGARPMRELMELIGAQGIDSVSLRHMGEPLHVMLVDDTGMIDGRPVNVEATRLYHQNCKPVVVHPICGDVVIVPDEDFA